MVATRETIFDSFGSPVFLRNVNSADGEWMPDISVDGRTLFFCRSACTVIWMARRATVHDDFGPPVRLPAQINVASTNASPTLSADGRTLYFSSDRPGGVGSYDLWQVLISPVVDFNGDGIVDSADMCIIVDHWGEDYSLCDIGPTPWGDGIVDVQDLIVLAGHLFEEILPPNLIAYWKLDETEGDIAYNSIGDNHGVLSGNPNWKPDSDQVAGALELDGIGDYITTDFVLDPSLGTFSAFIWIKGGTPGQVIISQSDGTGTGHTWLGMDALAGNLMTGLVPPPVGRFIPQPLGSQIVITDGQWHHVGFVWNGSYRFLYVDGVEVAKDTAAQNPLKLANGGLLIGTSKNLDEGTSFSGLIDDVRIYNVALSAEEIEALAR
jgi:hypothetical protein